MPYIKLRKSYSANFFAHEKFTCLANYDMALKMLYPKLLYETNFNTLSDLSSKNDTLIHLINWKVVLSRR